MPAPEHQDVAEQHEEQPNSCRIHVRFESPPIELDYWDDVVVARRFAAAAARSGAVVRIDHRFCGNLPPLPCRRLST